MSCARGPETIRFVLGRESLRKFIHVENESLREFLRDENSSLRELIRNQHVETKELISNQHVEMKELIRDMREESLRYHERREEEFREFMREITLRHERIYGPMIAEMEEGRREMEEGRREMEEGRKQIRANTEAVLRLLDRSDEPGSATA
jgi:hypothetical protein